MIQNHVKKLDVPNRQNNSMPKTCSKTDLYLPAYVEGDGLTQFVLPQG